MTRRRRPIPISFLLPVLGAAIASADDPLLRPVVAGTADVNPGAVSPRDLRVDLQSASGFDRVQQLVGAPRLFVRSNGATHAVFSRSWYLATPEGDLALVPPGTTFRSGADGLQRARLEASIDPREQARAAGPMPSTMAPPGTPGTPGTLGGMPAGATGTAHARTVHPTIWTPARPPVRVDLPERPGDTVAAARSAAGAHAAADERDPRRVPGIPAEDPAMESDASPGRPLIGPRVIADAAHREALFGALLSRALASMARETTAPDGPRSAPARR
ncbi:MAG: hypothetical protein KF817_05255 [Phycisphaeraceae bacterium]|nr:hypothetical protein [Phycisphaeraceae bacterium]